MITPDFVNGLFEIFGAVFLWKNVKMIRIDKKLMGVCWKPTVFFTAWGFWNLYYYPSLDQWLSFTGGLAIASVNLIWLAHIWYYYRHSQSSCHTR